MDQRENTKKIPFKVDIKTLKHKDKIFDLMAEHFILHDLDKPIIITDTELIKDFEENKSRCL